MLCQNTTISKFNVFIFSFFSTLQEKLPLLQSPQSKVPRKCLPLKPRSSFEAMCLSQAHIYKEMFTHLEQDIRYSCLLHLNPIALRNNPIALRKAKIVYNFGLSACSRVKVIMYSKIDPEVFK